MLLLQAPTPAQDAAPKSDPTVVKAHLKLKDVDLAELLGKLNVAIPVKIVGKISLDVAAEIPLTEARTLKAYRVNGKVTVPTLQIHDLQLNNVLADINLNAGVLTLTELSAKIPDPNRGTPGTVRGSAKFGVDPRTDLTADLKLTAIPLGEIFKATPALAGKAEGPLSGSLTLKLPGDKLNDLTAAVADGSLTSPGLTLFDRKVGVTSITLKLRDGVAKITDATTTVEGLPVSGLASLTLKDAYPFEATVNTQPTDVANLTKLAPPGSVPVDVRGKVGVTAAAKGTLSPLAYTLGGKVDSTELNVGAAVLDRLAFAYALDGKALTLSDLKAEAFKGTVTGSARVPFDDADAGKFDIAVKDLDASALTRAVPSLPLKLEGNVGGTVAGTLPPAKDGKPRQATVAVDLQAPKLRVQGIPTSRLHGKVDYKPGLLTYDLKGDSLGGTFDLDGTYPLSALGQKQADAPPKEQDAPAPAPGEGKSGGMFRISNARLARVADALDVSALAPLRGRMSLVVHYRYDEQGRGPFGEGELRVVDFGWADAGRDRSDLFSAIRVTPEAAEIVDLTGQLAGGTLRGWVRYNLVRPDRSRYHFTLDRADAHRILMHLGAGDSKDRGGKLTFDVRGSLGRELHGTGTMSASRTNLAGTNFSDLRVPFDYTIAPGSGGQVAVRDLNAQAAGGRLTGQAVYRWGGDSHLEGGIRLVNVGVRQLIGTSVGVTPGRMNGRFDFRGDNVKSINDVVGTLNASFNDPNPFDAPILRQLQPFLNPRSLITPFSEGDVRARLAGGVFRVERFTLSGSNLQLYADGTVGLNGRLDLDFKVRSGQVGVDTGVLRLFGLRIPAIGPIPLTVVAETSRFLSNRMVLLKVTGTIDNPSIQVNVAALLADEVIRYFLGGVAPLNVGP